MNTAEFSTPPFLLHNQEKNMTTKKRIAINRDIDASMKRLVNSQSMNDFMDDALPVLQVACYLRVSTSAQTTENQFIELIDVCNRHKWQITEVYEETISGTKGVDERYEFIPDTWFFLCYCA